MAYTTPYCIDNNNNRRPLHNNVYKYSPPQKPFKPDFLKKISNNQHNTTTNYTTANYTNVTLNNTDHHFNDDVLMDWIYIILTISLIIKFINFCRSARRRYEMKLNEKRMQEHAAVLQMATRRKLSLRSSVRGPNKVKYN